MDYWSAFILGLLGSLHCAGMCGPLALALPAAAGGRSGFVLGRLGYNLGRVTTYGLIGVVLGSLGKTLVLAGFQRWISLTLGTILLMGLIMSRTVALGRPITAFVGQLKTGMASLLRRRSFASLAVLGLLNGLLPCGLVYVAGAGAIATGDPIAGAGYMFVFGLGTTPMMLAISLSRSCVPATIRARLRPVVPASIALLAGLLILRGMSLGIPYVSPNLSASGGPDSCCHGSGVPTP